MTAPLLVHLPLTDDFQDVSSHRLSAKLLGKVVITNRAAQFSGDRSYIELPHIPIAHQPFAISFRVKPTTSSPRLGLVSQRSDSSAGKFLHVILNNGSLHFGFYADDLRIANGAPAQNVWTHYVFQFDGANKQIYLNGKLIGQGASKAFRGSSGRLRIGDSVPWSEVSCFRGEMRDFRIYGAALGETEIAALAVDTIP